MKYSYKIQNLNAKQMPFLRCTLHFVGTSYKISGSSSLPLHQQIS